MTRPNSLLLLPAIASIFCFLILVLLTGPVVAQEEPDFLRKLQFEAVESGKAQWVHWGDKPTRFSSWTNHSNRLVPIYTFGMMLDDYQDENSCYRDEEKIKSLYGELPKATLNPKADYLDQTDVLRLQEKALAAGKKNIVLFVFDGMDWQTSQAAAIYRHQKVVYANGRGSGLAFLDYGVDEKITDYGYFVCSPHSNGVKTDVDSQTVTSPGSGKTGGYSAELGGRNPWSKAYDASYLLGKKNDLPHVYTDSAASATSMNAGIKTYNSSINVAPDGKQVESIARKLQKDGFAIGVVSSVPLSHATPAASYANNVARDDYQDITRDLIGLPSIAHKENPLSGVDVLIGCGWGEIREDERRKQGANFLAGNKYLHEEDMKKVDVANGGRYVVAQRTENEKGSEVLKTAAEKAAAGNHRLLGFFGARGGHLPYQTADGDYDPTRGKSRADRYSEKDVKENPTLAEMTSAALTVLAKNDKGFWLMVEAGDVDWANHNNNIDDSIGAVYSGEAAFTVVTDWIEKNSDWDESLVIVTADHGHMMVIDKPEVFAGDLTGLKESKTETSSVDEE